MIPCIVGGWMHGEEFLGDRCDYSPTLNLIRVSCVHLCLVCDKPYSVLQSFNLSLSLAPSLPPTTSPSILLLLSLSLNLLPFFPLSSPSLPPYLSSPSPLCPPFLSLPSSLSPFLPYSLLHTIHAQCSDYTTDKGASIHSGQSNDHCY